MRYLQTSCRTFARLWALLLVTALLVSLASPLQAQAEGQGPPEPPLQVVEVPEGIRPGYVVVEGDMIVPSSAFGADIGDGIDHVWSPSLWESNIVPWTITPGVTPEQIVQLEMAMDLWEDVCYVDFVHRTTQENYVAVIAGTVNESAVGMIGGQQTLTLVSWNEPFIIAHELGHTLGLWHEQSRPDRDRYVRINWGNIQTGKAHNFDIPPYGYGGWGGYDGPYDFDSVMHYGRCDFSIDCPAGATCNCTNETITALPDYAHWQNLMGQRDHLSDQDIMIMSFLYAYPEWHFVDWSSSGEYLTGSYLNPWRDFRATMECCVADGTTLWIRGDGDYSAVGTYDQVVTLQAYFGTAVLGDY